jgi:hypothetical protein
MSHIRLAINSIKTKQGGLIDAAVLSCIPGIYAYFALKYLIVLPNPGGSDAMYYFTPAILRNAYGFTLVDRIGTLIALRLAYLITPTYLAGAYHIFAINLITIIVSIYWSYKRNGFFAGLFAGILLITSFTFLYNATFIYTDPTMTLFCLLAFIAFHSNTKNKILNPMLFAGIFAAFSVFNKLPGVVIPLYFVIYIAHKREWTKLPLLILGFAIGTLIVLGIFIIIYGYEALLFMLLHNRYAEAMSYTAFQERSPFFYLFQQRYIPLFLSLIILLGAYVTNKCRQAFFVAAAFITFGMAMSVISQYYFPYDNYLFPTIVFISIGLGIYLSTLNQRGRGKLKFIEQLPPRYVSYLNYFYAVLCLACITFAMQFAIDHYADILDTSSATTNQFWLRAYPSIPLLIISILIAIELFKSRVLVFLFIFAISLWCPVWNMSNAYLGIKSTNSVSSLFYTAPAIINYIPVDRFSIYVEEWNKNKYAVEIPRFYATFFNRKYPVVKDEITYANILYNIKVIDANTAITEAAAHAGFILTDRPDLVKKHFAQSKRIKKLRWQNTALTLIDINMDKVRLVETDFAAWQGNETSNIGEINKLFSPLWVQGNRGNFLFARPAASATAISIAMIDNPTRDAPALQYGYSQALEMNVDAYQYITVEAEVRITGSQKPCSHSTLFIQDNGGDRRGDRKEIYICQNEFRTISLTKVLNKDASRMDAGIIFLPDSPNTKLEIKRMSIFKGQ